MVTINIKDIVVGESDSYADIVVSLSAPAPSLVTVNYATANGTATNNGFDYETASGTLNFTAGEMTKVVRVALSEYSGVEGLEYFRFNLSSPTNAVIGQRSAMVSIVDDDTVVDTPHVFVRDVVVDEKAGTAGFVVMLGGPTGQSSNSTVTVDYATADSTAIAGSDYVAKSGTLTFAPGDSVKTVVVDIIDDAVAEGRERFGLNLSNAFGATIVDDNGLAEIGANDAAASSQPRISVAENLVVGESDGYVDIVVSLSAPAQNVVTVDYTTASGTANDNGFDYEKANGTLNYAIGETTKVVRVALSEYSGVEGLEYFRFNLSSPTNAVIGQRSAMVSIVDDDTVVDTPHVFVRDVVVDEKAGTAGFVVMLGGPTGQSSNSTVTVDYATADSTAIAGSDYVAKSGTLTFAPGDSVKTVVVDIIDDAVAEGRERFGLNLSNAFGATIVDDNGLAEIGANDAAASSQPRISVAENLVVGESDGYVDIVVSLSAPAQNVVTVDYTTASGTANDNGFDYEKANGTLNYAIGETTKVVRVALSEYSGVEGLEYFRFNLSSPTNAVIGQRSAMVSIVDDDTVVDTPHVFVRDVVVDEKAGTAGFVVMLGGPTGQSSNSTVTVDYATADSTAIAGSDYVAKSGTLTFAPGDSVKTVVVDIIDDAVAEGRERFGLNLSNAFGATIVDDNGLAEIGANDAAASSQPRISVAENLVVGESDGYVDIVVSLSAPAQNVVTVDYTTASGTANDNGFDYEKANGTLNYAIGETTKVVRVALSEYSGVEGLEYFRFNLSSATNAAIGQGSTTVSIVDDDTVLDTPSIFVSDVVADEKVGTASFVVRLGDTQDKQGSSSNSTVTVDYTTADGTAIAGGDYLASNGTLIFAPGDSVKTVVVDLVDDNLTELAENFRLNLSNATNAVIATPSASATIIANTGVTDTTAPTVLSFNPTDGATGVAPGSHIVLTFSESIARGTGSIVLKTAAGATIESFDAATSNRLTLSGSTLTIDPTSDLANGTNYYLTFAAGTVKDLAGNAYAGITTYDFTTATGTPPAPSYTVPGTLGNDFFIPSAGNNYLGGGGNDTYVLSPHTLSGAVTAKITDTEGNNVIQLVDGMTISASSFYGNAAQLTLASGAIVQILGASAFSYQVGANAPAGDTATTQTYSQFAATLGASVPTGPTPVPGTAGYVVPSGFTQAPTLTPAIAGSTFTVPGTLGNDFFIPSAGDNYLGGGGNDTYVISPMTLSGTVTAKITDTEGVNVVQWVDGMILTASSFYNDAAQLTLSTGAKVQILGASKFHFQLGANAPAGDTATSQTYAEFANTLGVTLPAAGGAPVSGTPNFVVPSSGGSAFTVVDLSSGTVTASAAAEEFRYDFQIVGGRITKAGDGEVTIHGFDVVKDKLVFVNTTNHTVYSEAEFKVLPGVSVAVDPFGNNTSIYLDPASGVTGGVTLTGIVDASLSLIVVETM
ncbi:Calx-beta domain-containing protein [Candidatus Accumulibacter contiguus]|uniref:Calx-beta domain-containing protein n=1 Tax=Candidatus Accumulibacter contiguus TaxID=2954381 RepID=UPI002FC39D68